MLELTWTSRLVLSKTYNPGLSVHEKPLTTVTPVGKMSGVKSPGVVGHPESGSRGPAGGTAAGSGGAREGSGSSDRNGNPVGGGCGSGWPVLSSRAGSHGPQVGGSGCPDNACEIGDTAIELTPKRPPNVACTCCTGSLTRTWYEVTPGFVDVKVEMHVSVVSASAGNVSGVGSVHPAQFVMPMLSLT